MIRHFAVQASIAVTLGLGIALALLCVLEGGSPPAVAAPRAEPVLSELGGPVPSTVQGPAERTLSDATLTHYVAITGTDSGDCSTPVSPCLTIH